MPEQNPQLAELLKTRTSLATALEENPIFKALQHVDNAIAALQATDKSPVRGPIGGIDQGGLTPSQRDAIAAAATAFLIETNNAPVTVKSLCEELHRRGVPLPEAVVSSVGGILGKRKGVFMKSPDMAGHWQLAAAYYEEHKNSSPQG